MLSDDEVKRALSEAESKLVVFAEMIVEGATSRAVIAPLARQEMDVLACLADEAPGSFQDRIRYLQDRYETLMKGLVN